MNHPLRYAGDTIYQQGFGKHDEFTTLQIASNPTSSWSAPLANLPFVGPLFSYMSIQLLACFIGAIGLMVHFGMHLTGFLRRKLKATLPDAPKPPGAKHSGSYQLARPRCPCRREPHFGPRRWRLRVRHDHRGHDGNCADGQAFRSLRP